MSSVPVRASFDADVWVSESRYVSAVKHIRKIHSGSQPHLMRGSDGHCYIVKFKNNPQHIRVLVNELLATRLVEKLGLPTTPAVIIDVSQQLIGCTQDLVMELSRSKVPCSHGLQFGSRYFGDVREGWSLDDLPDDQFVNVHNLRDIIGMLVFDKWTCNCDCRQFMFVRRRGKYSMAGIDQGFCFNAGEWSFPDAPLRGLCKSRAVYRYVQSMEDFEPWLSRLENEITFEDILEAAKDIPAEWYEADYGAVCRLLEHLNRRRVIVRELIRHSCVRLPLLFPKWVGNTSKRLMAVQGDELQGYLSHLS
jgi:hypothetical protein